MTDAKRDATAWRLVYATWALVLVTFVLVICSVLSTCMANKNAQRQIEENRRASDLMMRPYLNAVQDYGHPFEAGFGFRLGQDETSDTMFRSIRDIRLSSDGYLAVRRFSYNIDRTLAMWNSGRTPLRVKGLLSGTVSASEWQDEYNNTAQSLVDSIRSFAEWNPLKYDVIIQPQDTLILSPYCIPRTMFKEEFEHYLRDEQQLVIYPYTYIEYCDFFGNSHTVLIMDKWHLPMFVEDDQLQIKGEIIGRPERIRWDL